MIRADLHVHSTFSDGSFTREEIIRNAAALRLTHIAFTDHDTTQGVLKAMQTGAGFGITVIPAIEISAFDFSSNKKAHILGYNYQSTDSINRLCEPVLQRRNDNSLKQIAILGELGYSIDVDKVKALGKGCIYKQHILAYLCATGQTDELFGSVYKTIFKNSGACDFDIEYCSAQDAVRAIKADHGIAVLAHPAQQNNYDLVPALIDCGLDGIERNHPANDEAARAQIDSMCDKYSLLRTGGSDFHGAYEAAVSPLGSHIFPVNQPEYMQKKLL